MSTAIITATGLTKRFGDFTAVDKLSLTVQPGTIFAFLGANGSGKSTTIRMLIGLLRPTAGAITVEGIDVMREPRRVRDRIGYMGQKVSLYQGLTIGENVEFYAGLYGITPAALGTRWGALRERFDLRDAEREKPENLPAGIRQRAGLALATLHQPPVLFLDEPTAGVDPVARRAFWRIIRQLAAAGTTLFVTTHHLDEAEYCGRVGLMVDGRLVALDTPEGLKAEHVPGVLWRLAGAEARAVTAALGARDDVLQIQPFGNRVHVRVRGALAAPGALAAALSGAGVPVAVEPAEATLEDVFLELVGRSAAAANAGEVA
jgi:ABC-2 type transport system ATP-binding protein